MSGRKKSVRLKSERHCHFVSKKRNRWTFWKCKLHKNNKNAYTNQDINHTIQAANNQLSCCNSSANVMRLLPRPQSLSKGGEENEKKLFVGRAKKNSLLGNDITATDLYRLQLHCTVPNEGPAEEADAIRLPQAPAVQSKRALLVLSHKPLKV